jgi:hypothetical protein
VFCRLEVCPQSRNRRHNCTLLTAFGWAGTDEMRPFHLGLVMRLRPLAVAVSCLAVASVGTPAATADSATYVKEAVATGTGGAVTSTEFNASKAGILTLKAGGNAIDAAPSPTRVRRENCCGNQSH